MLNNTQFIIGGYIEGYKQISKLIGCRIERIGEGSILNYRLYILMELLRLRRADIEVTLEALVCT